jgi:hypothetical protein
MRTPYLRIVLLAVWLTLGARTGFTQVNASGQVNGTVTDPSGAVIQNANVTLKNEATGIQVSRQTNEAGQFRFLNVQPGPYNRPASVGSIQRVQPDEPGQSRNHDRKCQRGQDHEHPGKSPEHATVVEDSFLDRAGPPAYALRRALSGRLL